MTPTREQLLKENKKLKTDIEYLAATIQAAAVQCPNHFEAVKLKQDLERSEQLLWAEVALALDDITEWLSNHRVRARKGWTSRERMLEQLHKAQEAMEKLFPGEEEPNDQRPD